MPIDPAQVQRMLLSCRDGRFKPIRMLGLGAAAQVWLVHDQILEEDKAVKVFDPDYVKKGSKLRRRFMREAKLMAKLRRPTIVQIFDVVECSFERFDWMFLVMEYVTGGTLRDHIVYFHQPLHPRQAVKVTLAVLDALSAAHAREVIHRDIKPENILLTADGEVKLTDFGIAHQDEGTQHTNLTRMGATMGTPGYLAPEQKKTAAIVGVEADIYGLAVTLWVLLTGNEPGHNDFHLNVLHSPEWMKGVPGELESTILVATAERPGDRYRSVEAMAQELRQVINALPEIPEDTPALGSAPRLKEEAKREAAEFRAKRQAELQVPPAPVVPPVPHRDGGTIVAPEDEDHEEEVGATRAMPMAASVASGMGSQVSELPELEIRRPPPASVTFDDGMDPEAPMRLDGLPVGTLMERNPMSDTRFERDMEAVGRRGVRNFAMVIAGLIVFAIACAGGVYGINRALRGGPELADEVVADVEPPVETPDVAPPDPSGEGGDASTDLTVPEEVTPEATPERTPEVVRPERTKAPPPRETPPPREVEPVEPEVVVAEVVDPDPPNDPDPPEEAPAAATGWVRLAITGAPMVTEDGGDRPARVTYHLNGPGGTFVLSSTRTMEELPSGTYSATVSWETRAQNQPAGTVTIPSGGNVKITCDYLFSTCD